INLKAQVKAQPKTDSIQEAHRTAAARRATQEAARRQAETEAAAQRHAEEAAGNRAATTVAPTSAELGVASHKPSVATSGSDGVGELATDAFPTGPRQLPKEQTSPLDTQRSFAHAYICGTMVAGALVGIWAILTLSKINVSEIVGAIGLGA